MELIPDCATSRNTKFPDHEWVRARHDSGALSPGIAAVLKMIETELAWLAHRGEVSS